MKPQFALVGLLAFAPAALAETLVLKNGAEISGILVEKAEKNFKDPRVTLRVAGGEIAIAESMIREKRKDHATSETIQRAEDEAKAKAAAANQERRERMMLAASAFDAPRREMTEARPASFSNAIREKSIEEIGAGIEAKLELLRDFERRGLSNQTRRAILDELFPNQRSQPIVW